MRWTTSQFEMAFARPLAEKLIEAQRIQQALKNGAGLGEDHVSFIKSGILSSICFVDVGHVGLAVSYASSRTRFLRKDGFNTCLRRRMDLGVTSTSSSSPM